ncbi:MAG: hypothetical protein A7316_09265 [Candidatus Altiarchaeales archaeon WOR_SM1_86-2]|nr:MAG: hypothetical protein A7316_09265 [Candidatus Altiarchaeales archaeon WOR_SM1_86-2]
MRNWDGYSNQKGLIEDVNIAGYNEINVDFYMMAADLESGEYCRFVVSDDDSTEIIKTISNGDSCEYSDPDDSDTVWDSGNCHFSINVSDIPGIDMSDNELTFRIGGYIPGSGDYCKFDDIKITGINTGVGNVTDQDTENTTYTDVTSTAYGNITSITVKVEVDSYNPEGSVWKVTDDPDLELFMYDGSSWVSMGTFDLPGTYTGFGLQETNYNFTITTTNPAIISAWESTSNRDLRIRGVKMDGVSSPTKIDEINYTNLWVIVETESIVDPFNFGLEDYWFVDSDKNCPPDPCSPAGLSQDFTSPTNSPVTANLTFKHSGSADYFGSGAVGFCNLTHPGGETQVWFENWTSDPHGGTPVTETIDIKNYITSDNFTYTIECGAVVTESGGRTIIAFDEIDIEIEYTGAGAGDDGWDYGYGNDAYGRTDPGMASTSASYENEKLKVEVGGYSGSWRTDSAAWGVQIYISQSVYDDIDDGATATVSFDWTAQDRNYDTEEPCWVKSRFYKLGDADLDDNYLGSNIDGGDHSDNTDEIMFIEAGGGGWDTESGTFTENIASYITGPGWYYLDFGAKFRGSSTSDEGILAWFDNVMIEIAESDHYIRKHFSVSSPGEITGANMRIFSDDGADVYLNGHLIYSDPGPHSAYYWNNETSVPTEYFVEYDNVVAVKLYGDDSFTRFDMELEVLTEETREGHILVMSDGEANEQGGCGCSGRTDKECAIDWGQYACGAGISVYAVGFGTVGDGLDEDTLKAIACNESMYYSASDAEALQDIYYDIAREIVDLSYTTQKINITEGSIPTDNILHYDSYIDVTYIPEVHSLPYGAITISLYSDTFGECGSEPLDICTGASLFSPPFSEKGGWFKIPDNAEILSARVTSYSSDYWTDEMYACSTECSNETNWHKFYDINTYSSDYSELGDAYTVNIPVEYLAAGEINYIRTGAAVGPDAGDKRGGSPDNRVIYEFAFTGITRYSQPFEKCVGSNNTIFNSYGGNVTVAIGENASDQFDPANDSVDFSLWRLLDDLNFENDPYDNLSFETKTEIVTNTSHPLHSDMISDGNTTNPIDIQITSNTPNVYFGMVHGENIRSLWGPSKFEVIVWM